MNEDFDLVRFFHENTKRNVYFMQPDLDMNTKPAAFKEKYASSPRIKLPKKNLESSISLRDCILRRRTSRNFVDKSMSIEDLSMILGYSYGITESIAIEDFRIACRPVPSAGALYPLEVYPIVFNVNEVESGVYHYSPVDHSIELLKRDVFANDVSQLFIRQFYIDHSCVCLAITATIERTLWKYGGRGYRYILLEAGHLAQNICLVSAANGLSTLPLGGFFDNRLAQFLNINPDDEPVIYGMAIGYDADEE